MGIKSSGLASDPLTARLVKLELGTGRVVDTLDWSSEEALMSSARADQEFTTPSWWDAHTLLQPTHTELLWLDARDLSVVRHFSHPLFHSVHHAVRVGDGFAVASTGIDSVLHFDSAERLMRHAWLPGGDFAARGHGADLRRIHHDAFKPHSHHPNFLVRRGEALWATCLSTADCRPVAGGQGLSFGGRLPHDGTLVGTCLAFTLVDGFVSLHDPTDLRRLDLLDLRALSGTRRMLGWCRGVAGDDERLFVGMTMLRKTRSREVMRRMLRGEQGLKLPTRVLEIDLRARRIVREIEVGNAAGGTIYGLSLVIDGGD